MRDVCYNSERGELYSKKLANFVGKRLKSDRAASVRFFNCIDSVAGFLP